MQVYNIPLRFRNREVVAQICETVGTILSLKDVPNCDGGSFIRVRVLVDISQPLCCGRLITVEDGKEHWVSFKYERLSNLCYWYGCLTHDDRDCETWINSEGTLKLEDQQFGPWLRAPPFIASRKKVVSIPSFFAKKPSSKPTQPTSDPPPQQQTAAYQASMAQTAPPSRSFNVRSEIQGHKASPLEKAVNSKAAPPLNQSNHTAFEEVLQDIDRNIQRFDKVAPTPQNLNEALRIIF